MHRFSDVKHTNNITLTVFNVNIILKWISPICNKTQTVHLCIMKDQPALFTNQTSSNTLPVFQQQRN